MGFARPHRARGAGVLATFCSNAPISSRTNSRQRGEAGLGSDTRAHAPDAFVDASGGGHQWTLFFGVHSEIANYWVQPSTSLIELAADTR